MRLAVILLVGVAALAQGEESARWKLNYFYDQERSTFVIVDLKFPSPKRGMAVGAISSTHGLKPMSAITLDGGAHWSLAPLEEAPESLFFLNEGLGWMVTEKGLSRTEEFGKPWRKLKAPKGLARVYFTDPDHGWAVGSHKQIYETKDGGVNWAAIPEVGKVNASEEYTNFGWIEFAGKDMGLIGGWSKPPRRDVQVLPDWLDPEMAANRREWPQLAVMLDTFDGGKSWKPVTASLFGEITATKLSTDGWSLGLIEFFDAFDWPSEVFYRNWKTGIQKRVYREKNRKVTDLAIAGTSGPSYLGAVEHFGKIQQMPVPQKVVILRSEDAEHWTEMPVDYRAVARRVMFAVAGPDDIWAATDTGMILKLTP